MKKILLTMIFNVLLLGFTTSVDASMAISIGTDYGSGADSSGEATTAHNMMDGMGYNSQLITTPTSTHINTAANVFSVIGNDGILFFHGHASSDNIVWNYMGNGGQYAVGITRYGSMCTLDGYDLISTSEFGLEEAKLAIFMGCNTATNSTNIAKDAYSNGASATLGWAATIYDGDTDKWVNRFFTKLADGYSINNSITYANSFTDYAYNSAIKAVVKYGSLNAVLSSSNLEQMLISDSSNAIIEEINLKSFVVNNYTTFTSVGVANYIKKAYDEDFDISKYHVEHTINMDQEIYDFNLLVNGIKSNIGYTVFIENSNIIVIDNMKEFTEESNFTYTITDLYFDEDNAIKNALAKHPPIHENVQVTLESTLKRYDAMTGKTYFDVNIRAYDTILEVESIVTETFEI